MKFREIPKLPDKLRSNTEAALVISSLALLLAAVALLAATRTKGGDH